MAKFHLTDQSGGEYEIDAPDEHAAVAALAHVTASTPPPEAESKGLLHTTGGLMDAAANGMSFGLADRAKAAATALDFKLGTNLEGQSGSADYGSNLAAERARGDAFHEEHPYSSTGARIFGNVLGTIAGARALAPLIPAAAVPAAPISLGAKTLLTAGAGAGGGAVQGAIESKDYTDPAQVAKDAAIGGGTGAVLGGLIPGASKIIGAGYQKVANALTGRVEGMSREAGGHLVKAVEADGPAAVQARLAELGPDAMLPDAGAALLGKAQGAILNSDEARSILKPALDARNVGTNVRVQSDVNRALGPAEDPQTVTDAINAHRTAVDNVNYPAALHNAPDVRTAHILQDLDNQITQTPAGSMEHRALTNLRDMMMTTERRQLLDAQGHPQYDRLGNERWQEVPVSQSDAGVLHKVKGEIDNVVEYDAPGLGVPAAALSRQQGALKMFRGQLNDALEQQVPGYANANRVSAALARRAEAVNLGTQYLGAGKTTASPDRFAGAFDPLSQGEKIAFAKGSRGEIERNLGTKANDLQALRGQLQGEGGWNTAKIATVHGQPGADELMATVERNLKFRDTHNKVVENSQTAQRLAAAKEMKPDPSTETPFINPNATVPGMLATAGKKAVVGALNALTKNDPTRSYGEVARALTEQGTARDARLMAVVNAINARQGNATMAPKVGNVGAVVAALLGNAALRGGPMRRQGTP